MKYVLKPLQNVSKTFHSRDLAIYHRYLTIMESTPVGGPAKAAPHCCGGGLRHFHNGGWGDKWLDKVDETLLNHFARVSKMFHPLYPAIYRCLGRSRIWDLGS